MNREERAKQFMPFDALKGLHEALRLKEFENERTYKGDISQNKIIEISKQLSLFDKKNTYYIKFFLDGYYYELTEKVLVDFENKLIKTKNYKINFIDLFEFKQVDKID